LSLLGCFSHGLRRGRGLKALAYGGGDIVHKDVASAQPAGYVHSLLPSLELASTAFLKPPILLKLLILIIVVVEVQVAHLVEATRKLAPGALPLSISSLTAGPSHAFSSSNSVSAHISWIWASDRCGTRGPISLLGKLWLILELEKMGTFHAVPCAVGDCIETNAVGVIGGIAAVAKEEDIFPLCRVADRARIALFLLLLLGIIAQPLGHVEFGDLLLVLDFVFRDGCSCIVTPVSVCRQTCTRAGELNLPSTPL
jgi:hypothetical protein